MYKFDRNDERESYLNIFSFSQDEQVTGDAQYPHVVTTTLLGAIAATAAMNPNQLVLEEMMVICQKKLCVNYYKQIFSSKSRGKWFESVWVCENNG